MRLQEYSKEGKNNQQIFSERGNNFYNWIFEEIKPYLRGNILEIGSGVGNFSKILVENFPDNQLILSDFDKYFLNILNKKYCENNKVKVEYLDLNSTKILENNNYKINTCIAINILEHIENDVKALENIYSILESDGVLILLVPAHKFLYNIIDKDIGHYRRYAKREIVEKINLTSFNLINIYYFNLFAIFGWFLNGKILKKSIINEDILGFYNKLIPLLKVIERYIFLRKIGISLIVVLKKESSNNP